MQHLLSVKIVPLVLMFTTMFIYTVPSRTPQCQLQNGCQCLLCSQRSMASGHASCCSCGDRGPRIPPTLGGWSTLPWHMACFPTRPSPLLSSYFSPGRKGRSTSSFCLGWTSPASHDIPSQGAIHPSLEQSQGNGCRQRYL